MAKRKSPRATATQRTAAADSGAATPIPIPRRSKHQKMLDQMQSTLGDLRQQIQPPTPGESFQTPPTMMPPGLAPNANLAKQHVSNLHQAFLNAAMTGKSKKVK